MIILCLTKKTMFRFGSRQSLFPKRHIHYIVVARDYPDGLARRLEARPAHLERAAELKKTGFILIGGATMQEDKMDGSFLLINAKSRKQVEEYILSDPYVQKKVSIFRNISARFGKIGLFKNLNWLLYPLI